MVKDGFYLAFCVNCRREFLMDEIYFLQDNEDEWICSECKKTLEEIQRQQQEACDDYYEGKDLIEDEDAK